MRRLIICLAILPCLSGCNLNKGKIKEYALSDKEASLLEFVGLKRQIYALEYSPSKNAGELLVKYYHLEGNRWVEDDCDYIKSDDSEIEAGRIGFFIKENFTIECSFGNDFVVRTYINEMHLKKMPNGIDFVDGSQEIELNQEMPIAMMSYGSGGNSVDLDFFYHPEVKEEMERIEAITISFRELEN